MSDSPSGPKAVFDWAWVALGLIFVLVGFVMWTAFDMGIIG